MRTLEENISLLHVHVQKVVIVCTGAGAGCQNLLAQVPGASGTILESIFPYSYEALADFINEVPRQCASEDTALKMATHAWRRATELLIRQSIDVKNAIGLSITAAIATNRPLRGKHRAFLAIRTNEKLLTAQVIFSKNDSGMSVLGRNREGEICDLLALNMMLWSAGLEQVPLPTLALNSDDLIKTDDGFILNPREILSGDTVISDNVINHHTHILFPGSFNPLHFGHEKIAKEVENRTGKKVVYTIDMQHPDKGEVNNSEKNRRLEQFRYLAPVLITSGLKLYKDKAKKFPGFTFIIGVDTLERMLDPKYGVPPLDVLRDLKSSQTHFLVVNRYENDELVTLKDVFANAYMTLGFEKFKQYAGMFEQVSTVIPISSTKIRFS